MYMRFVHNLSVFYAFQACELWRMPAALRRPQQKAFPDLGGMLQKRNPLALHYLFTMSAVWSTISIFVHYVSSVHYLSTISTICPLSVHYLSTICPLRPLSVYYVSTICPTMIQIEVGKLQITSHDCVSNPPQATERFISATSAFSMASTSVSLLERSAESIQTMQGPGEPYDPSKRPQTGPIGIYIGNKIRQNPQPPKS